jgi:hypothetical protein
MSAFRLYRFKHSPLVDVFTGEGWLNWSRYLVKKDRLIFIAGQKLDRPLFNELQGVLHDNGAEHANAA